MDIPGGAKCYVDKIDILMFSLEEFLSGGSFKTSSVLPQSVHKQQQLQHQEFQRHMEERLELLQRQQPFLSADIGLGLVQDSDYLEVVRARSESSDHSSPNVTPRASNHSNLSVPELGSCPYERDEAGTSVKTTPTQG